MKCANHIHHLPRRHFPLVFNGRDQIDCKLKIIGIKLTATLKCRDQNSIFALYILIKTYVQDNLEQPCIKHE